GHRIPLTPEYVIGHFQIDSIGKPYCPGVLFPWSKFYSELAIADKMSLGEYEEHIAYTRSPNGDINRIFALYTRSVDLKNKLSSKYKEAVEYKIMLLAEVVSSVGGYQGEVTPVGIIERIIELCKVQQGKGKYSNEAARKLLIIANE